jgi:hypothetical protein
LPRQLEEGEAWRKVVKEREEQCPIEEAIGDAPLSTASPFKQLQETGVNKPRAFTSHDIGDTGSKTASPTTGDIGDADFKRRRES